jgi:uncharacterized membrane protein YeaQ/YmgE (transglycosylase-associated protein family)
MNLIAGIVAGGLVGWLAFKFPNAMGDRSLQASLLIGVVGGALGVQLVSLMGMVDGSNGGFNLFSLVVAFASAIGCLVVSNMIARGRGT